MTRLLCFGTALLVLHSAQGCASRTQSLVRPTPTVETVHEPDPDLPVVAAEPDLPTPEPTETVIPEVVEQAVVPTPTPVPLRSFTARISAYAPGCGDSGLTRTGTRPGPGTISVDPRVIPLGSQVRIEGLPGLHHALDTGGAVLGERIDRWVSTCHEAIQWGVQYRQVEVLAS